jgi:hypothetical protein
MVDTVVIVNREYTIVDDEFLFVKDGLIRLWEHRIRGSPLLIHMTSDSWNTQKENVQTFVWNIFIISIHGLVYFHQNTKQFYVEFPETKDAITLKQHQQFFLECIDLISDDVIVKVISITCIGLYSNEMDG